MESTETRGLQTYCQKTMVGLDKVVPPGRILRVPSLVARGRINARFWTLDASSRLWCTLVATEGLNYGYIIFNVMIICRVVKGVILIDITEGLLYFLSVLDSLAGVLSLRSVFIFRRFWSALVPAEH